MKLGKIKNWWEVDEEPKEKEAKKTKICKYCKWGTGDCTNWAVIPFISMLTSINKLTETDNCDRFERRTNG